MTNDLRDALDEIASESVPPAPSTDLWRRGRRRHRVRQGASALAALAVLVGLGGTWSAMDESSGGDIATPPDAESLSLPARVWRPSVWTQSTDDAGPPGAVAVVFPSEHRSWFGRTDDLVAVSALDGSYRFLSLPGEQSGTAVPSPDGRYVLYTNLPHPVHGFYEQVHVYDAKTGEVVDRVLGENVILSDETPRWLDDETVLLDVCETSDVTRSGYSCSGLPYQLWNVVSGGVESPAIRSFEPSQLQPWGSRIVVAGKSVSELDRRTGETTVLFGGVRNVVPVANPSVTRFATLHDSAPNVSGDDDDTELQWARVPGDGGRPVLRSTGLTDAESIIGWVDDATVAIAKRVIDPEDDQASYRVEAVALLSGEARTLISFDSSFEGRPVGYASDLLTSPLTEGHEPPDPLDPRVRVAFFGAGGVAIACIVIVVVRRRGRPGWS
jgi:hypothetical protein